MRVLTLSLGVPFPPHGGGLTRTYHLMRALADDHELVLAAYSYGEAAEPAPFPVRVVTVPWLWSTQYQQMMGGHPEASRRAYEWLTYESDDPWFVSCLDPAGMTAALATLRLETFDAVLIEGTPVAQCASSLPRGVPRILDLLDVKSLMSRRAAETGPPDDKAARDREAERTLAFERSAAQQSSACLTVSPEEAVAARELLGADRVHVVPNGVDTSFFTRDGARATGGGLLFTGMMSYAPNADAVRHFALEILPLIRREEPQAVLHVVGGSPVPEVTSLASDSVIVHGRVPDMRPYYRTADVVVVPVREGGGTRVKVLEAAASGCAIVTTPLGVEGLSFSSGENVVVAESPAAFAAEVVRLLRNPAERERLGVSARRVAERYAWSAIGSSFREVVESMAESARASAAEHMSRLDTPAGDRVG